MLPHGHFHNQGISRRHKIVIANRTDFLQHDRALGKIFGVPNQPPPRLDQRFEHQHPWHDRKSRKVIGQILFRQRQVLQCRDGLVRFQFRNAINQQKTHSNRPLKYPRESNRNSENRSSASRIHSDSSRPTIATKPWILFASRIPHNPGSRVHNQYGRKLFTENML